MKNSLLLIIAILLLGSFFACNGPSPVLSQVESIIDDDPKEALSILCSIPNPQQTFSKKDFALYSLLVTQAMDKCDVDLKQDSLINNALAYYRVTNDSTHAAKAYFYAGRVAEDSKNTSMAVEYYLRAKELMKNLENDKEQYSVRFYLGRTYKKQWLREEQIEITREAIEYAKKLENKAFLPLSYYDLGVAFSGNKQYDSALVYLENAEKYARIDYKGLLSSIYYQLWFVHDKKEENEKANVYADSLIKVFPNRHLTNLVTGIQLLNSNNSSDLDSSIVYLWKSLQAKDLNIQASSLLRLGEVFEKKTQYDSAVYYLKLHYEILDSIDYNMRTAAIIETQKLFDQNRSTEENVVLKERDLKHARLRLIYFIIISVTIIIFILIVIWVYLRKRGLEREKKILVEQQENERLRHEANLYQLREFLFKKMNSLTLPSIEKDKYRLTDEDWETIYKNANDAFDNFVDRIKEQYPTVTESEIRLCCLIKMEMSIDLLSSIQGVGKKAIYQQKSRLAKDKLGLSDGKSLDEFLRKF